MEDFEDCLLINHFQINCEYSDLTECLMVYMEWSDGSNFQFLGSLNSVEEWENLKQAISLLCVGRGLAPFSFSEIINSNK